MNTPATHVGADPDVKPGEVTVQTLSPRDMAFAAMEDRADEAHMAQIKDDVEADPGAAMIHDNIVANQNERREAAVKAGLLEPLEDGVIEKERMHPEQRKPPDALPPANTPEVLPANLQDDPLADYIVMDEGQPMFTTVVNGTNMLIPLDEARRKLQIGTAAEIRMQTAAGREKELNAREQRLTAGEAALAARVGTATPAQPVREAPVQTGLNEAEISREASEVITTMFRGTEEEAGAKLTKLLMKTRTPLTAAPVDTAAIVEQASNVAISRVAHINDKKDLRDGYVDFTEKYPDIMADVMLYNMADGMTDDIAIENPLWSKSEVMFEAGKRTSEWVDKLKGTPLPSDDETDVTLENDTISEHTLPPETQNRQERKRELVVIPTPAHAVQTQEVVEEVEQTPQEALDEMRRSRGQAV